MPPDKITAHAPSYQDVLAANLRTLRERMGLTQDELATRLRRLGFDRWTRSLVASQEHGRRSLSLEDAIALCFALGVPFRRVVPHDMEWNASWERWIRLSDRALIRELALVFLLQGHGPEGLLDRGAMMVSGPRRSWRFASPEQEHLHDELLRALAPRVDADLDADGRGELEMDIAKRLAQSTPELNGKDGRLAAAAGHRLWGHSPSTERDLRAEARPDAKQHISREIRREIAELVSATLQESKLNETRARARAISGRKGRGKKR